MPNSNHLNSQIPTLKIELCLYPGSNNRLFSLEPQSREVVSCLKLGWGEASPHVRVNTASNVFLSNAPTFSARLVLRLRRVSPSLSQFMSTGKMHSSLGYQGNESRYDGSILELYKMIHLISFILTPPSCNPQAEAGNTVSIKVLDTEHIQKPHYVR